MAYTIDVYRNKVEATEKLSDFLLYVSFFPQLVAGPIERAQNLLPQIARERNVTVADVFTGLQLMLFGFFKKMVIADNLGVYVDRVYSQSDPTGSAVLIATYAFSLQIYCDFAGYTDIARGTARCFGIRLRENFLQPYMAISPTDFWRRWHISLSSWLRDYLYIPLGGNRYGRGRLIIALLMTMFLGGLWHGAAWHFVLWGVYHGVLLIVYRGLSWGDPKSSERKPFAVWCQRVLWFHLVCFGWLIFRSTSFDHMTGLMHALFNFSTYQFWPVPAIKMLLVAIIPLFLIDFFQDRIKHNEPWTRWPAPVQVFIYPILLHIIIVSGNTNMKGFIYFQF